VWELHNGVLVEKPAMNWNHGDIIEDLGHSLRPQLNRKAFRVRENEGRLRKPGDTIFISDIAVVPVAYGVEFRDRAVLAVLSDPLPLVVEVWSPSTGDYDVDAKAPIYQQRGDLEIWRIHPYERTLTAWVRQPDGSYLKIEYRGGIVSPTALPGVEIDLDQLFAG
ncbi:MAG: Uma2 family endonuclease, partial [Thermomicrobiales bacterium]